MQSRVYPAAAATMLTVFGVATPAQGVPARRSDARLDALVERWFDEVLALHPLSATLVGEHRYDDRLAIPDRQQLGQLFAESWRAARLVVETGMHAQVLAAGALPLAVLEIRIDRWLAGFDSGT